MEGGRRGGGGASSRRWPWGRRGPRASGCGAPQAGSALGLVPRCLTSRRSGFCLAEGGFQASSLCLLFWKGVGRRRRFSRDHRRPPRGTGGEARAGGGGSSGQAGVGSPAAARTQESTCNGRSPEKGMAGAALAPCWHPKLGCRCSIQGSLPAGELAPSLMHRPFSILPSFALGAKKDQMNQG